jgi:hypothetical protein
MNIIGLSGVSCCLAAMSCMPGVAGDDITTTKEPCRIYGVAADESGGNSSVCAIPKASASAMGVRSCPVTVSHPPTEGAADLCPERSLAARLNPC